MSTAEQSPRWCSIRRRYRGAGGAFQYPSRRPPQAGVPGSKAQPLRDPQLAPRRNFATVDRRTLKIVERAVATLISTQGLGDLYQLYLLAHHDGSWSRNLTYIRRAFREATRAVRSDVHEVDLYQVGRETMLKGTPWHKYPPGYDPVPINRRPPA